jgi:ribosomal protein S27AE
MSTSEISSLMAGLGALFGLIVIILIAFLVVYIIGLWKLFKKAGKQGWEAIIPFYNSWVLVEISGLAWWWFLISISSSIISILGIDSLSWLGVIASCAANFFIFYNLGKKFHKEPVQYGVLGLLFGGIMVMIMGYSKDMQYDSSVIVSENGPIDANKTNNNTNTSNNNYSYTNTDNNTQDNGNVVPRVNKYCPNCGTEVLDGSFCPNCGTKVN